MIRLILSVICSSVGVSLLVSAALCADSPATQPAASDQATLQQAINVLKDSKPDEAQIEAACDSLLRLGPLAARAAPELTAIAAAQATGAQKAADTLRRLGPPVVPYLVTLIDSSHTSAQTAATILSQMGPDARQAVPELRRKLRDDDFRTGIHACHILAAIGSPAVSAVPDLRWCLSDPFKSLRVASRDALLSVTRDADPSTHEATMRLCQPLLELESEKPDVRIEACRKLEGLGPAAALASHDLIDEVLNDPPVHDAAIDALRATGSEVERPLAYRIVESGDVQSNALLNVLPKLDKPARLALVRPLREALEPTNGRANLYRACRALGRLGADGVEAILTLYRQLDSSDEVLRNTACDAIIGINPDTNRELLRAFTQLRSTSHALHFRALDYFETLGDHRVSNQYIPVNLAQLLLDADPVVRNAAARGMSAIDTSDGWTAARLKQIEDRVNKEPNYQIAIHARLAILQSLVRIQPRWEAQRNELWQTLMDDEVGDAMADAIAQDGPAVGAVFPTLKGLLSGRPAVRERAARAMAGIATGAPDPHDALATLSVLLDDPDAAIRASAAEGISRFGKAAAPLIPRITKLLDSRGLADVTAAARALSYFGVTATDAEPAIVRTLRDQMAAPGSLTDQRRLAARAACADALVSVAPDSPQIQELLLLAVRQRDWTVREGLSRAIAKRHQKPHELVGALVALSTQSPDSLVRTNARCALREIGETVPSR